MEQQKRQYDYLDDFIKSDKSSIIHLSLQFPDQNFGNEELIQIQSHLALCTEIKSLILNLDYQIIKDDGIKLLFRDFKFTENLNSLSLELTQNQISQQGISIIAQYLKKCSKLTKFEIDLFENEFGPEEFFEIIDEVSRKNTIQDLKIQLGGNELNDQGVHQISVGISKCQNITNLVLFFKRNNIKDEGASEIGKGLRKCSNLIDLEFYLDLSNFDITHLDLEFRCEIDLDKLLKITKTIKNIKNILSLKILIKYLNYKQSDDETNQIGECLAHCKNIKDFQIWLYGNQIGDRGIIGFAKSLSNCNSLLTSINLSLFNNQIGDKGLLGISTCFSYCSQINNFGFSLYKNNISNEGYINFEKSLQLLGKLLVLECHIDLKEQIGISKEMINSKNIKIMVIHIDSWSNEKERNKQLNRAMKIKRLVELTNY
ncbi:hypothetical protein ABPG73_008495 [Tetrahymena malaccensis]